MSEKQIKNNKILIFGGSGSLGNKLIDRLHKHNTIYNYSRDECKHWQMEQKYGKENIVNKIGDIANRQRVETILLRLKPDIVIIAAALKHVDRCEYSIEQAVKTNITGPENIVNVIENNQQSLSNLKTVVFVSTDKACSPINVYGMTKAISEKLMIEKAYYIKDIKFVTVRYGNVLNSRGSIIPFLNNIGKDDKFTEFPLTDVRMTRFIMTLEDSCKLIEYAITKGNTGEIIIPRLNAMNIKELMEIFSEKYNKPVKVCNLRVGEKLYESLINDTQSLRAKINNNNEYYHLIPNYLNKVVNNETFDYNSTQNILSKDKLKQYLKEIKLL